MILCVDSNALKTSLDVQKDVNLEEIVNSHTKYYDSVEDALKDDYVPLDFCVTMRSIFSNLVLQIDKEGEFRYYTNLKEIPQFIHKGYDLIMFLTSIGVMHSIDYKVGFDELMTKHSQFQPIGLYNPDPSIINPIIYTHVIISDEGAELLPEFLKSGRQLVPIDDIKREGNITALLNTIIKVKEEDCRDEHDNDKERI